MYRTLKMHLSLSKTYFVLLTGNTTRGILLHQQFVKPLHISQYIPTRQLPMGAGHCQLGGLTDRNI